MVICKESLLAMLHIANYKHTLYEHPAVFTTHEAEQYCSEIPGAHVKNLFLRNKKKTSYLLVTISDKKYIDLIALGEKLGLGRLSFANGEDLVSMLGVQPGSVTPFSIINDKNKCVKLYFDHDLLNEENISIHPMINTATVCIKLHDLISFIEKNHHEKIEFINLPCLNISP